MTSQPIEKFRLMPRMTAMLLGSLLAFARPAGAAPPAAPRFPVIGYFPSWTGAAVTQIQFDKLTHVNYAFVNPTPDGGLTGVNAKLLEDLVKECHAHGVKVSASLGGWKGGNASHWKAMASRPASRAEFVKNVTKLCDLYKLDGIDIDWEYPDSSTATMFAAMIRELGESLHKQWRILSATVNAMGDERGAHIRGEVFNNVDFIGIRAYDWNWAARNAPHSTYGLADSSLDYWLKRGCPRKKAVLGVPFYGRSYNAENTYIKYRELVELDDEAPKKDQAEGYYYNGIPTLMKKTELAIRKGGGIMIWEISQDTTGEASLLGAIHNTVLKSALR
jgi:chitinase